MASTRTTGRPRRQLTRWQSEIARHLPHLHRAELTALAIWSFAATLTEHIGQTTCAAFLAQALDEREDALRQRLREFYRPAAIKRGDDRRELDVRLCFGPLLAWALHLLRPREVVLALDPTLVRERLAVLAVALVVHGCAIPVAWVVVEANAKGAWMPRWAPMLARLHAALPARTRVTVLADRGLASTALFEQIRALGWHPVMRLTRQGSFRALGQTAWMPLGALPIRPVPRRARPPLCQSSARVHARGDMARGLRRAVASDDRSARGTVRASALRPAVLDRAGLPLPEVRWSAVRADAHHRRRAG